MATRIIIALITIGAIAEGVWPGAIGGILPLVLVILGLLYGGLAVDAEDATAYLVVTIAVGAATGADVLNHIHFIGGHLDMIFDQVAVALYAGVITILCQRAINRLKG